MRAGEAKLDGVQVKTFQRNKQEKSMLRIVLGVISGFITWLIAWVGSEKILSAIWAEGFGAHQRAFEEAIKNGGQFTADTTMLLTHIVVGSIVSVMSGFLAALIAGENIRAPLVLGFLLVALGLVKAVMSWPYVPIWYHVIFTAILIPMTIIGGKL
jgi:F0F1-type ATP synthase assembly protein I